MEKLKRLREERGLSQVKLAARADVNPSTVNQIERGMRDASPGTLRKLADALDISLYELMMEEEAPKAQAPLPLEEATDAGQLPRVQAFLGRHPSDTSRIAVAEGVAGALEGYYRRWNTDLDRHIEEDTFPYGMGLEVGVFYD